MTSSPSRAMLLRDLTLSAEAPMAFCVRLLLQQMLWTGRPDELFELISSDPRQMDLVDARNLLLRLGYGSRIEGLESWSQLNPQLLPALYVGPGNLPYVLSRTSKGELVAGNVNGRTDLYSLPTGGWLVFLQDKGSTERVTLQQQILYRFTNRISVLYGISFALALLALTLPFYIRAIYNVSIPSTSLLSTFWIFLGAVVLFVLDWILRQWRTTLLSQLSGRLDALLGVNLVEKLFGLDYRQIETLGQHGLTNRLSSLDGLLAYLQGPLALACLDFPFVVIYLGAIALIAGPLVFVPLVLMVLSGLLVWLLSRYYTGASELNLATGIGILQAQQELVNRFLEVKLANVEWVWLQRLRGLSAQSTSSALTINRQVGRLQVITSTIAQLAGVLTLAVGVWMAYSNDQGPAAMGNLIAAMFFVFRVFTPFQQLMNALLRFDSMRKQYGQLDQFFKLRSSNRSAGALVSAPRMRGSILLDSAACRLGGEGVLAITRVSLSVAPGELLAITGNAGCGKSTVLRVVDQLYPLVSGTLLFDGKDYRQFSAEAIQRNIAYLMPQSQLLPGTIWSNLTAMNPDATVAGVRQICASLGLLDFLDCLPDGFDTSLTDEVVYQLPNGVRRLMALAQALIKDTPILLIDDISQGLAPDQFQAVLEALPSLRRCTFSGQDRSIILATDNKLLLEKADRLCILDKGVTSFQGTAEELRARMQQKAA
ncbi:ATP-binding cassette domain-containing protein [Cyanobium sp. BA5m-21]|uniref:ATP-binding cassette domain-containing protein n=1 Tax=unclassified Cyanobium TaxID=2627006 RepID=UPI0020CB8377|nr:MULTISPECIES: ATP-binding cassette domain-containing protein [unclassified Cyanobium]MCP9903372.1 ATP-binding cassette domain-containing protein [Cyanobium sp. BA5m-10]MCP9906225.1 ATP-binding cassette domain-containing protein [Cyanobium sp. BA5m-21]